MLTTFLSVVSNLFTYEEIKAQRCVTYQGYPFGCSQTRIETRNLSLGVYIPNQTEGGHWRKNKDPTEEKRSHNPGTREFLDTNSNQAGYLSSHGTEELKEAFLASKTFDLHLCWNLPERKLELGSGGLWSWRGSRLDEWDHFFMEISLWC